MALFDSSKAETPLLSEDECKRLTQSRTRGDKQVEAKVNAAGKSLFAQDSGKDMYAAIDGLIDKLDKQVRRHKDRVRGHHASAAKRAASLG